MGENRMMLRCYLWADDGVAAHLSIDPWPDCAVPFVKADLGDDDHPGLAHVAEEVEPIQDRNGRIWHPKRVDVWGWEWQFERRNMI